MRRFVRFSSVLSLKDILYLIAIAMTGATAGYGQAPPLVTDRPGFTDSAVAVPKGAVQLEGGIGLETDHASDTHDWFWGTPLLRIGLGHNLEARVDSDGVITDRVHRIGETGIGDASAGFKYQLMHDAGRRPDLAVTFEVELPTGSSAFREDSVTPSFKLAWAKDVSHGFAASGNFDWASIGNATGRIRQLAVTLGLDRDLGRGFGAFVEAFGIGENHGGGVAYFAATGLTHGIGANAQWDCSVTRRLTQQGPDWAIGGGLVFRHLPARHH